MDGYPAGVRGAGPGCPRCAVIDGGKVQDPGDGGDPLPLHPDPVEIDHGLTPLQKCPDLGQKIIQPVVMHPVAGAIELHQPGVLEVGHAAVLLGV